MLGSETEMLWGGRRRGAPGSARQPESGQAGLAGPATL